MRNLRWLILLLAALAAAPLRADGLSAGDLRVLRDLQARNLGVPSLSVQSPRQEALLALAELGGAATAPGTAWTGNDQDALFALLQRYRDELLSLGMDSAELEAQLEQLQDRSDEVERRLALLKPKDGLKIHARFAAIFDDTHTFGNASLSTVYGKGAYGGGDINAKAAYKGSRVQLGLVNGLFDFEGTRGPLTGRFKLGVVLVAGTDNVGTLSPRQLYVELRTPVAVQFGDIDVALTPLTLWRNDSVDPYEPEPFLSREKRLRDDLLLVPDKWTLRGARLSSDVELFGALTLNLESITSIMAYNYNGSVGQDHYTDIYAVPSFSASTPVGYVARYNVLMEAWKVGASFGEAKDKRVSYNGVLFWDDTSSLSTVPSWAFRSQQALVQSGRADLAFGPVSVALEAALSAYTPLALTWTPTADPLTGTALTGSVGWKGGSGSVRAYGRAVGSGFHSAGAQGRTVDKNWQFLGPLMTENSQIGSGGKVGLSPGGVIIPPSFASRLNDTLIPPGLVIISGSSPASLSLPANAWNHLLPYFAHEEIDPYGEATPNRAGFGVETSWSLAGKSLHPSAGYEAFSYVDPAQTYNYTGVTTAAFTLGRLRAGLDFDLEPLVEWLPLSVGAGYTSTSSSNGLKSAGGKDYSLATTLLDYSVMWGRGHAMGLAAGYRILSYEGLHPFYFSSPSDKETWDMLGLGAWWRPQADTSVDLVYSSGHTDIPDYPLLGLQTEQVLLRLTTEF